MIQQPMKEVVASPQAAAPSEVNRRRASGSVRECPREAVNPRASVSEDLPTLFKKAMRRLTTTVSVIATNEGSSRFGIVATAVTSVSSEPPAILVCINQSARIFDPLTRRQRFTVNLLRESQRKLIPIFSGQIKGIDRFQHGSWSEAQGLPFLIDAQASLFCHLDTRLTYATHEILIGRVEKVSVDETISSLLWRDGRPAAAYPLID